MDAATLHPDATRCPDCRGPVAGSTSCSSCGLSLTGPDAVRLWQVDTDLLQVERVRSGLLQERSRLIAALHAPAGHAPAGQAPAPVPAAATQEESPRRVQDVLLVLGGLLLAGAGLVFAAVTYERLGATGRALVLVALTIVAAAAAPRLRARGLRSTAETVGAVALVLAALDAYGLRTLGLAQDSHPLSYTAGSAAVLAAAAAGYARHVPLRVLQAAAVVLAQLPVPLLLVRSEVAPAPAALALALLVGADLGALAAGARLPRPTRLTLAVAAGGIGAVALAMALSTVLPLSELGAPRVVEQPLAAAAALVACAVVLAGAGTLAPAGPPRSTAVAAAVPVVALAAYALLGGLPSALVLSCAGLVAALVALRLSGDWGTGTRVGALLVAAGAVALVAGLAVEGLLLPLTWLLDPWTLSPGASARDAVAPLFARTGGLAWAGSLTTPAVLLVAALTTAAAAAASGRRLVTLPPAVLALGALVLLPLALDLSYAAALGGLLLLAVALAAAAAVLLRSPGRAGAVGAVDLAPAALAGGAAAVVLLAAAWSTAAEGATLVVLPLGALVLAGLAVLPLRSAPVGAGLAGLLAASGLGALGASRGLAADQVGALLVVAVAALLGLAAVLDARRRLGAEAAAAATAVAAVTLTSDTVGWLSWTLAGLGVLVLATAVRSDRRAAAPWGGLLLTASSWVRLADAGVSAPEPYVLPLAALALVLGHLRRRAEPGTPSWEAYGAGLSLALVPSLLQSFDDTSLTRPLLVGLAALGVLLVGARTRLQAPLAIGGAVLLVDALQLLGPYAAALPRWLSLGAVGALLLVVGATYEQRRLDVGRLRERYDALT